VRVPFYFFYFCAARPQERIKNISPQKGKCVPEREALVYDLDLYHSPAHGKKNLLKMPSIGGGLDFLTEPIDPSTPPTVELNPLHADDVPACGGWLFFHLMKQSAKIRRSMEGGRNSLSCQSDCFLIPSSDYVILLHTLG